MSGALTWHDSTGPRASGVGRDRPTTIGRAEGADVRLDDTSVSREQAAIRFDGTGFRIANRSRTNPTRVNGQRTEDEVPLRDGDEVLLGAVKLRFHDLSVHDTISGPVCSHCGRENSVADKDCWFCGTSLVSAASTLRARRTVVGRVVADDGQVVDLYDGQSASLAGGAPALRQQGAAGGGVEVSATAGRLSVASDAGIRQLTTGEVLEANGTHYVVIVRG